MVLFGFYSTMANGKTDILADIETPRRRICFLDFSESSKELKCSEAFFYKLTFCFWEQCRVPLMSPHLSNPLLNLSNQTLLGGGVQRSTEEVSRRGGVQRKDGGNFLIVIPCHRLGAQVILFSILSRFSLTLFSDNLHKKSLSGPGAPFLP